MNAFLKILIQFGGPVLVQALQTAEPAILVEFKTLLDGFSGHVSKAIETHPANKP
jgi:hypothetical protein